MDEPPKMKRRGSWGHGAGIAFVSFVLLLVTLDGALQLLGKARRRCPWGKVARIALASLVLLVVTLEVGVHAVELASPGKLGKLRPELGEILANAKMEAHPYLAYSAKPGFRTREGANSQVSHNKWGFRGPSIPLEKGPDGYRIVCLGGSSTYGHGPSSDAKTWPARLQQLLNAMAAEHGKKVDVINGGLSGWSTFESTINLAFRMVEWEPDIVIVYHSINDMRCALYNRGEPLMDNRHWRDILPRVVEAPGERLLEHSMTYLVLRKIFTRYADNVDALNTMAIVDGYQDGTDWYGRANMPERGFKNFERNLRTIHAIATEHGARVIFASQANDEADMDSGSRDIQLQGMRRMETILRKVAAEKGAVFVDAKAQLEAKAAELGIDKVFTKEVHLTDLGADKLAQIFARAIILGGHGFLDR